MIRKEGFKKAIDLFLISFLSLFFELAIIRWTPGVVSSMSYFTNLILISTFLGLGLGCVISHRSFDLVLMPALFVAFISCAVFLQKAGVSAWTNISDFIFLPNIVKAVPMSLAIPLLFFLIFFIFMFIGVILGRCLDYFKPLVSYSINVLASIFGVVTFTLLSFKFTPPYIWFFLGFLCLLRFLRKQVFYATICFISCLFLISLLNANQIWSPYYKLEISRVSENEFFRLTVNNDYQQQALDFSPERIAVDASARHWRDIYNLPYLFTQPKKVLILGSGVGNDVLLAVKNNTGQIDAVEIDPGIVNIGKRLRPDNPYVKKNVQVFVDDARAFMNKSKEKYDLIVYGFLDSHALFANMASVRLDNFVYTIEGIKQAKSLLTKYGTVSLSFYVGRHWIGNKLYYMIKDIFGQRPLVYASNVLPTEQIFIISLDKQNMLKKDIPDFSEISDKYESSARLPLPRDDWPYFYLENKTIPYQYLLILSIIFVLSTGIIFYFLPKNKNALNYSVFFFLGAAFMLIETKSIVQLSLLFGATWVVNSAVISGILTMILIANLYALKFKPKKMELFYILLAGSLLFNWFFGTKGVLLNNQFLRTFVSVFIVTLPLFFAAIIFAFLFRNTEDIRMAFGMNLLGVVLGGFLEYLSLILGLNNLALLALIIYFLSFLGYRKTISLAK